MSSHPTEFQGSVIDALREAIERQIPDSRAEVNGALSNAAAHDSREPKARYSGAAADWKMVKIPCIS